MGWAGVVFKTIGLFIPQEVSPRFDAIGKEDTPFVGFRNLEQISDHDPEENFETLRRLKEAFPEKVIVSSIMGRNEAEWTELARRSEQAGADIIECNFSCPQMCGNGLGSDVGQDLELVRAYTAAVRKGTRLPILAKMTPNLAHMELPAIAAVEAGADGLAAINTVKSITGVDLDSMASLPQVDGRSAVSGYSGKAVKPIALRFIYDMASCDRLKGVPISGMGGIETWQDAAEFWCIPSLTSPDVSAAADAASAVRTAGTRQSLCGRGNRFWMLHAVWDAICAGWCAPWVPSASAAGSRSHNRTQGRELYADLAVKTL